YGVQPGSSRSLQGFRGSEDVAVVGARERADGRLLHMAGNRLDRLEVAVARCREAGLDDIDTQPLELTSDAQLLVLGHRRPGRLLAVTQRRVENDQLVAHVCPSSVKYAGRSPKGMRAGLGAARRSARKKVANAIL